MCGAGARLVWVGLGGWGWPLGFAAPSGFEGGGAAVREERGAVVAGRGERSCLCCRGRGERERVRERGRGLLFLLELLGWEGGVRVR